MWFLTGMLTGEVLKSMHSSEVFELSSDAPVAAARPDEMRLDVSREARLAVIDPRSIRVELARGWSQEQTAFEDQAALLYFSGPFFEEHKGEYYDANAIGDLFVGDRLQVASEASRPFADRRYFMALRRNGTITFGFGGWHPGFEQKYATFVGGLGYLFNEDGCADTYSDPYKGFKQEMHNMIPRERLLVGRDAVGHLMVMKTLPLPMSTAEWLAKSRGFIEAYYMDQGNKARFIVPGRISDAPRYNLPYLIRISDKASSPFVASPGPLSEYGLHQRKRKVRPTTNPEEFGADKPGTDAVIDSPEHMNAPPTPEVEAQPTPDTIDLPIPDTIDEPAAGDSPPPQLPED